MSERTDAIQKNVPQVFSDQKNIKLFLNCFANFSDQNIFF